MVYGQDDYLEVKGNTKVDTSTFSGNTGSPLSSPVRGEITYDSNLKSPYYFDGSIWHDFIGIDRTVGSRIVAASDSLDRGRANYVCTGTNDQAKINLALSDLNAAVGGAVYLLEGTYNISGSIIFTASGKSLIGAGAGTVLKAASGINVITAGSVNYILISQLRIDGNNTGSNGIDFNPVTYSKIDKVWVEKMNGHGIHLKSGSTNNIITGNNIQSNSGSGIYLEDATCSNNIISGNNIQSNSGRGIGIDASSNNVISGNNVRLNRGDGGIYLTGLSSQNNIITGNIVWSNVGDGFSVNSSSHNIFASNIVWSNYSGGDSHGIDLYKSSYNVIFSNNIQQNGRYGIHIWDTCSNNLLFGNVIGDNGRDSANSEGICIGNTSGNNLVSSNIIFDAGATSLEYPITINTGVNQNNYLVGNLIPNWTVGGPIIDAGSGTQYTDKVKMTLEKKEVTSNFSPLDVDTNPRSYICLKPSGVITLTLSNGKSAGDLLILENVSTFNITINDGGNTNLGGNHPLGQYDILKLIWNGARWLEMKYVDN
jgi:parallel beta-helix repeat protein